MTFIYPYVLLLLPAIGIGGYFLWRYSQKLAQRRLALFSPSNRLPAVLRSLDVKAKRRKEIIFLTAMLLLVIALARPAWGPINQEADSEGAEFYFVLDISKSMLVRDVEPNRLQAVKESLGEWLRERHGDRIGLILVAGDAFVQAPLTTDYTALRDVLMKVTPNALSLGGTKLSAAIVTAVKALEDTEQERKIVVIISDGEDLEGDVLSYVSQARTEMNQKIQFFTVGVGTPAGGPVPQIDRRYSGDFSEEPTKFVRDEYGVTARSRLDERTLRNIARVGDGRYYHFDPDGDTWQAIYEQAIEPLAKKNEEFDMKDYIDLFQIPLFFVIILLAWEFAIPTRLKNPPRPRSVVSLPNPSAEPAAPELDTMEPQKKLKAKPKRPKAVAKVPTAVLLALSLLGSSAFAQADAPALISLEEAQRLVEAGQGEEAAARLREVAQKNPEDLYALYNYAVAAYSTGQFLEASKAFAEVSMSRDHDLSARALTQMGNAQFRLGQALTENNREGTLLALERSVNYYRDAIDESARSETQHNLSVASQKLEKIAISLGDRSLRLGQDSRKHADDRSRHLQAALERYELADDAVPDNPETAQKIEKTRELLADTLVEAARNFREEASEHAEKAAAADSNSKKDRQTRRHEQRSADGDNQRAIEHYQAALDVEPENQALQKELDEFQKELAEVDLDRAEELINESDQLEDKSLARELDQKQKMLEQALEKIESAMAADPDSQRGEELKQEALEKLEQALTEDGQQQMAKGDERAERSDAAAGLNEYNAAVNDFQEALAINPENQAAQEGLGQAEEKLAEAFTEAGKKEMAKAEALAAKGEEGGEQGEQSGDEPGDQGEQAGEEGGEQAGEEGGEPSDQGGEGGMTPEEMAALQDQIGHMEKAAQSFAQADALDPGANQAAELAAQANSELAQLRGELDQAMAAAAAQEGQPGEPGEGQPGDESGSEPMLAGETLEKGMEGGGPDKPILSFSDIRGSSEMEGQFRDKSKPDDYRDW
ncbi:MAG: VWA domain-containing protein [Verrucomicrobiota bacterium]